MVCGLLNSSVIHNPYEQAFQTFVSPIMLQRTHRFWPTVSQMKVFGVFALFCFCFPVESAEVLPKDVSAYLKLRDSCDHWRGEYGFDAERQADINWSVCQSCPGTDAILAKLKHKYRGNKNVLSKLNKLEPEIEPKDKSTAWQFCKNTRKPEWYQ